MIRLKFWWPGYSPQEALDPLKAWEHQSNCAFEICEQPGQWRPPKPGASLGSVTEWMEETGRSVLSAHLLKHRRNGRWEGLFLLEIGPTQNRKGIQQ